MKLRLVEHPTRALGAKMTPALGTGTGIVTFSLKLWLLREIVVLNHLLRWWVAIFPMAESSSFPAT